MRHKRVLLGLVLGGLVLAGCDDKSREGETPRDATLRIAKAHNCGPYRNTPQVPAYGYILQKGQTVQFFKVGRTLQSAARNGWTGALGQAWPCDG